MAYFSNSSEGECLYEQCARCKYGDDACPIFLVQSIYNYDACNNPTARNILDALITQDGTCTFWEMAKNEIGIDPNQTNLFEENHNKCGHKYAPCKSLDDNGNVNAWEKDCACTEEGRAIETEIPQSPQPSQSEGK